MFLETEKNTQFVETRKSKRRPNTSTTPGTLTSSKSSSNLKSVDSHISKEKSQPKSKKYNNYEQDKKGYKKKNYQKQKVNNDQVPQAARVITIKDYVEMVIKDLSERPELWHFSSYGLNISNNQTLPFPFLGTTEISPEELRLQVYAEAAATGGRIDNYVKVVQEIKDKAELTSKSLVPNLDKVISDLFRVNNVTLGNNVIGHQEALKQTLKERLSATQFNIQQQAQPQHHQLQQIQLQQHQLHEPLIPPPQPHHHPHQSQSIIPDEAFSFGSIPEFL